MNQRASLRGGAVLAIIIGFVPSLLFLVGGFVGGAYIDQRFPEYVPFIGHHSTGRVDLTQVEEAARYIQADYVDTNVDPKKLSQASRSEEHTSELQSQSNLVCRLLLEKKKKQ